jgi:TRAP-type C4-dicarboxylate transport system permease small subunit
MYSAIKLMQSIGQHVLIPGIVCLLLAALLLGWWELGRLTSTGSTGVPRWLPAAAITAGGVSIVFIAVQFLGVA